MDQPQKQDQKQDKVDGPQEDLTRVLTALQQSVIAVNNLTKGISAIFPSTS